jgi:hypothetical protein
MLWHAWSQRCWEDFFYQHGWLKFIFISNMYIFLNIHCTSFINMEILLDYSNLVFSLTYFFVTSFIKTIL